GDRPARPAAAAPAQGELLDAERAGDQQRGRSRLGGHQLPFASASDARVPAGAVPPPDAPPPDAPSAVPAGAVAAAGRAGFLAKGSPVTSRPRAVSGKTGR